MAMPGRYSSDTGHYHFTTTVESADATQNGTYESEPVWHISIYREGQFQITIQGSYLDVTVSVITGASPVLLTAQEKSAGTTPGTESDDWD